MKLFLIDDGQLTALRAAAKRLYSENRLDGNAMRDMAQSLDAIVRVCEQLPSVEPAPVEPTKRCALYACRRSFTPTPLFQTYCSAWCAAHSWDPRYTRAGHST